MRGSVPFSIYCWDVTAQGVLRLDGQELVLDISKINIWTLGKSRPVQFHIPLKHVEALEYKRGFLTTATLQLRVRNLEYLASVPGSDGAEITLHCKRKYRNIAKEFAGLVTLQLLDRV